MASSYNYSLSKKQEFELLDVGEKLLRIPSSTDEILILLEKVESILEMVSQVIPNSQAGALLPLMKALIADELLRHSDLNIQVAVASCLNKITIITSPEPPYPEDQMKEIFQLFMVSLKQLLNQPGSNFMKSSVILETLAELRSCLMMLDIKSFHIFACLAVASFPHLCFLPNHSDIFKHMETIMILMINEGDEVSLELLVPLLVSVRKDIKEISPIPWELGKTIFEKCGPRLQPYLREAVELLDLKFDDYDEIVASIANGPNMIFNRSNGEELVNVRIKVWWPLDKKFYPGTVNAFYPSTKKHKVKYDDNEEETLNLGEEIWERLKE